MVEFLSDDWLRLVEAAAPVTDPSVELVLDMVVIDEPHGEVRHRIALAGGQIRAVRPAGPDPPPDATLTLARATAVGLATGQLSAHTAFLQGSVKLAGDLGHLQRAADALPLLVGALEKVRSATTYPDGHSAPAR